MHVTAATATSTPTSTATAAAASAARAIDRQQPFHRSCAELIKEMIGNAVDGEEICGRLRAARA